jgi:hypothetical protein
MIGQYLAIYEALLAGHTPAMIGQHPATTSEGHERK